MSITMKEIAAMAKVSRQAVASVLNGKGNSRVSNATRARIAELAREYAYEPNRSALRLKGKTCGVIGVSMPCYAEVPHGARLVSLFHNAIAASGRKDVYTFWQNYTEIPVALQNLLAQGVDGLIVWDYHACLANCGVPAVTYQNLRADMDSAELDFFRAWRDVGDYLAGLGHREIGFLGYLEDKARKTPFSPERQYAMPIHDSRHGYDVMRRILQAGNAPTAFVAANDSVAYGAIAAARALGLDCPRDFSVIGVNNTGSEFYLPPLTTLDTRDADLTGRLLSLLLRRMDEPDAPVKHDVLPVKLILRDSCAPCRKHGARCWHNEETERQ